MIIEKLDWRERDKTNKTIKTIQNQHKLRNNFKQKREKSTSNKSERSLEQVRNSKFHMQKKIAFHAKVEERNRNEYMYINALNSGLNKHGSAR